MTAFFISTVNVKNPSKMQEYSQKAGATFAPFGGELALKGAFKKSLIGNSTAHNTGVIKFPDMPALEAWFGSDDYQALAKLRDEACDMTLSAYEGA